MEASGSILFRKVKIELAEKGRSFNSRPTCGGVEETIRFHQRHSPALRDVLMESFDRFQLAGLALICLKNETKADAERDLRDLISAAGADVTEKAHALPGIRGQSAPAGIGKVQPGASAVSSSEMDIKQ